MLNNYLKNMNLSAVSEVKYDGKTKPVVYMSAVINPSGSYNVNKSVQDYELYLANKEAADADMEEFEQRVDEIARNQMAAGETKAAAEAETPEEA